MIAIIWKILGPTLVSLAVNIGLPKAVEWLMGKGLPSWLIDGLVSIIKSALDQIKEVKSDPELSPQERAYKVKAIRKNARVLAKVHCSGTGCSPDTKEI